MQKQNRLYTEKDTLVVKYCHPKSRDFLHYDSTVIIKASGKMPVEMKIKFAGIYPLAAPMPPEEYKFKAATVIDLHAKYMKWFRKYGYICQ